MTGISFLINNLLLIWKARRISQPSFFDNPVLAKTAGSITIAAPSKPVEKCLKNKQPRIVYPDLTIEDNGPDSREGERACRSTPLWLVSISLGEERLELRGARN
jgi:hypothetical protein